MADNAVEKVVNDLMNAWTEFKDTSEENEKRRDTLLEDKMTRLNAAMDRAEGLNQKLTLSEQTAKAQQEQLDRIEAAMNRASLGSPKGDKEATEHREAFDRVMRTHVNDRRRDDMDLLNKRKAALVKSDDTGAGYLLAPPDLQADILKDVVEQTPARVLSTVRTIGVEAWKQPKRTGTAGATRVGEKGGRGNTGDPEYGMIEILAPEMIARFEISQQMLEDSGYDLLAELRSESSEQFSVKQGQEWVGGAGSNNQAEGILVNPDVAFTVSGNATGLTGDGLIDLYHDLKTAYARNGIWTLNRRTLGKVRKLKDGEGNFLWLPGLANGVPNTILGATYAECPDMPDVAAGSFPIAFGDYKRGYIIVDRIAVSFMTDYTTGADDGLVVFRGRMRTGGGVRQPEAIRKLKIAA
ncbi:phage major capsid protein [Azospirillum sp. B510]|uniref:phage major capsid protein n=1 Tax=Azospirillum sp. (strain B510) TaxID=137722 RepID=UPI0001C4C35C|nr:phage major capsid protein [Azospirillum sp. B510]BAI71477.1 phage major capsid protein [Azospirillum sp. B510]BAI72675.1 phage major capsid protein [Azospirillum sp. B510]